MQFYLANMTCGGCGRAVSRAITAVDAHARVITDPPARLVTVETAAPPQAIIDALTAAGFPPGER